MRELQGASESEAYTYHVRKSSVLYIGKRFPEKCNSPVLLVQFQTRLCVQGTELGSVPRKEGRTVERKKARKECIKY